MVGTFPWRLGASDPEPQKRERKLTTNIHFFLLPDCGCNVISDPQFLPPHDGLHPSAYEARINPPPLRGFCRAIVSHTLAGKLTHVVCFDSTALKSPLKASFRSKLLLTLENEAD